MRIIYTSIYTFEFAASRETFAPRSVERVCSEIGTEVGEPHQGIGPPGDVSLGGLLRYAMRSKVQILNAGLPPSAGYGTSRVSENVEPTRGSKGGKKTSPW